MVGKTALGLPGRQRPRAAGANTHPPSHNVPFRIPAINQKLQEEKKYSCVYNRPALFLLVVITITLHSQYDKQTWDHKFKQAEVSPIVFKIVVGKCTIWP